MNRFENALFVVNIVKGVLSIALLIIAMLAFYSNRQAAQATASQAAALLRVVATEADIQARLSEHLGAQNWEEVKQNGENGRP